MRRSFLLSRRLHTRHQRHPRHPRHPRRHTRHHPRYHRSYKHKRHLLRRTRRHRPKRAGGGGGGGGGSGVGGGGNETIGTWDGTPFTEDAIVTNSKGVTRSIKNIVSPLNDSETSQRLGDNDI